MTSQYAEKPREIRVRFTEKDIFDNYSKFKSRREYVKHLFLVKGYRVTEFHSRYAGESKIVQGLKFLREDSDVDLVMVVVGVVGENLRAIAGLEQATE